MHKDLKGENQKNLASQRKNTNGVRFVNDKMFALLRSKEILESEF